MTTDPQDAARKRSNAIQVLEDALKQHVEEAQRLLWEGLLQRLKDLHADASLLPVLLQEYANTVLAPLAALYGQSLLNLPALQLDYFAALGLADYQRLRAPLTTFLTARLGLDAQGNLLPGGYLSATMGVVKDRLSQQVLTYAFQAQASGAGIDAYRDGLNMLVVGNGTALGVVQELYKSAGDDFSQADRMLQHLSGKELGLRAALYQGGVMAHTRAFCEVRNGRVFVDFEIAKFGTKADPYGGYTNKAEGLFAGKPDPYDPYSDCGGYNCRHTWHYIPNATALRMRPDLGENDKGELFIKPVS
ncbi:hypothetical protein [Hymenobacter properus]|uniref:Uncharacterized protein n=1 Tax=Hymenobacter properus TaxID=2791026 RepID=A0A931FJR4_9BACT|nr:hypothetical protein [Hymenobacter properus]MBF9140835.1 hypothetical protein [Hymenobacter properus]MBR7719644.1 hypothetical protein [Microvirga sp. SRT04]